MMRRLRATLDRAFADLSKRERGDLALVVIVTHWLGACLVADRIADDRSTNELEIHGYTAACRFCRSGWKVSQRNRLSLPPFQTACRCFAQPVYRSR